MSEQNGHYFKIWESFWRDIAEATGEAFWDSSPENAAARDIEHFREHFDKELPLVDFGCGNGRQTRFLANHFGKVLGLDVSSAAIEGARKVNGAPNVEYRTLDALSAQETERLHEEVGDCNLYVRAVIHQLRPEDRSAAVQSLAVLTGRRGRIFLLELSPAAEELFRSLGEKLGAPPPKLARVFAHGITPAELKEGDIEALFYAAGFETIASGASAIFTTQALPDGEMIKVPAAYSVMRRTASEYL